MWGVAYSPDGCHIISGSSDKTIQSWDADTSVAVGNPLEGYTDEIRSVVYSSNGQHIISSSFDKSIRIWDARTGAAIGRPLEANTDHVMSITCSPDREHIASGSWDTTIHMWNFPPCHFVQSAFTCDLISANLCGQPDANGWVRDSKDGLLYWVPLDCHVGLNSLALLTIPLTSHTQSVALDFKNFLYGTTWTQIFTGTYA